MKKLALLLALSLLLSLCACAPAKAGSGEEAATRGMPVMEKTAEETAAVADEAAPEAADEELDLSGCRAEEAFLEIEHLNTDPRGYVGLRLRFTGEVSRFVSHDKTFVYVGVRDEDGCIENLELRFSEEGGVPADFPEDGAAVTVWGRIETYEIQQGGERSLCPVLTEVQFIELPDFRD